jgi:pimeloyl-ACP methyl ester carboxylesterase
VPEAAVAASLADVVPTASLYHSTNTGRGRSRGTGDETVNRCTEIQRLPGQDRRGSSEEPYDRPVRVDRVGRMIHLRSGVDVNHAALGDPLGVPVLLLHAWGESLGCFDRLTPSLPTTIRALAMDLRGHGSSEKPANGYSLIDCAGDVTAFLEAMDLPSAVLVGSSSGGYVAQQVAISSPTRVRGLVLVGAPRSLQGRPLFADEVDALTDPIDRAWVHDSLRWFPRFHHVPDWYMQARVDDGLQMPARVWRQTLAGLTEATPPTEAGRITTPTLIIWGGRDRVLPRADADALATAIPGSRLIVYPGTGHLVLWEEPTRLASDVAAFVAHLR